jgi:hypothetical protein
LTRKTFLKAAILAPGIALNRTAAESKPAGADSVTLENNNHRLRFDPTTGAIVSLSSGHGISQEFIPKGVRLPVFRIQYLDKLNTFRQIDSLLATETSVIKSAQSVSMSFRKLGGQDLHATVGVRITSEEQPSYWSFTLENRSGLRIADVQFPFLVLSYELGGKPGSEELIVPFWLGRLYRSPKPQDLEPDSPRAWQFRPENQATWHYPGLTMAQFLAYYNDRAGVLVRCLDTSGNIKQIKAVHHAEGLRLGFSHAANWPSDGERRLEYEIAVQCFEGDWYRAAEVYRDWSLQQTWARTPLHQRKDVPDWLLESPPHIMIRLQGELDEGPTKPNHEFLPYSKLIPLLERVAKKTDSPLVAILMAWERGGPWVYPDCFPPIGGDEAIRQFSSAARERQWHVGSYSNGTRWVTQQLWSGYEGENFFRQNGGSESVCRTSEGAPWRELWDIRWRPSYTCCAAAQKTRELAAAYTKRLASWGLDWIQFLDQNVGCSTFPCYSRDHGHDPQPSSWMTQAMKRLLDELEATARSAGQTKVAFSVESTPNEFFMKRFPICDIRVSPPGYHGMLANYVPLYHFLHHEFLLFQGGFGFGPEPYHLATQTAYNFVLGEIGGGVLTGSGRLLNKDSINWAPWQPEVGDDEPALELLRCATAMRRGQGRPYVVFGRMEYPVKAFETETVNWTYGGKLNSISAVFHAAWRSPEQRFAIALANWTDQERTVAIKDERLSSQANFIVMARESNASQVSVGEVLRVPALSCALLGEV